MESAREAYRHALYRDPQLKMLFFELTGRCNLHCKHCGSNCSSLGESLSEEDVFRVLDSIAHLPKPMICLSGGEPMLHPRFFEIAREIKARGYRWGLTTNGTLADGAAAKELARCGLTSVSVSLDGDEETHNTLRGSKTAFRRCVSGIENIVRHCPMTVTMVTTVVHKGNFAKLEEIGRIVEGLHVDYWRLVNVEPIGRARDSDLLLSGEEMNALFEFILKKRETGCETEVTYGCPHFLAEHDRDIRDGNFLCGAGLTIASVLSNGDYYACLDIERRPDLVQGNVKTDDFAKVWKTGYKRYRADRAELCGECRACEYRTECAGDSAHTWDFDADRPLYCIKHFGGKR